MVQTIAPLRKQNYVVMEVKKNLIADERKRQLEEFSSDDYKKIAVVVMGEPAAEFKARTHSAILAEKQKKAREEARKQWQVEQRNKKRKAAHDKKEENKSADAMDVDKGEDAAAEEKKVEEVEETVEEAMQK